MAPSQKESELVRKVHDNVLAALLQKEREVQDELDNITHVESKLAHMRDEDALRGSGRPDCRRSRRRTPSDWSS
ncbi:thioredoxin family protein, putative [Babesia ovata]|uniref:Thioredoxin family protein, putative n=1 Tax=Babesia ovata TaxID=189622 RepID=A0A2H6KH11_9APIC|nr:thioredoxin family protein, putative [Babesia ovata]GBE62274.1 thioredoxin family protein, putative [Babesia ovata]